MTGYTIRGEYPRYRIHNDTTGELLNRESELAAVMRWFTVALQPGDTIVWEKP